MMRASVTVGVCLGLSLLAADVRAAEGPAAQGEASVGSSGPMSQAEFEEQQKAERAQREETRYMRTDQPWIKRWRPERNMLTLGIYGGIFLANEEHDFYDPRTRPQEPLWAVSPDVGLRLGYFPLRVLGVEAEFSANPTRVRSVTDDFAFVYGFRGHAVAQLPFHSVTPFFLVGGGAMGVRSNIIILGNDIDPAFHYGGGVKAFFNRWVGARLEVRNIVSAAEARQDSGTSHVQVLAGVEFTFLRKKPEPLPPPKAYVDPDRDRDGFLNEDDECPDAAGVEPHGCPDTDGDGFRDSADECPEVPGVAPVGCPDKDTDGDRIFDSLDRCIDEPEVYNGLDDTDGCPDELPKEVEEFEGVLEGIEFDFGKATIRARSKPILDDAIAVLEKYEFVRIKVVGHTDNVGDEETNLQLSKDRAQSVKDYLVEQGIAAERVETDGLGQSKPRDTNDTEEGRAKNRRIEFEVLVRRPDEDGDKTEPTVNGKPAADASSDDDTAPDDASGED